jgi:[citrate (pro-3S)-lyase] ligase
MELYLCGAPLPPSWQKSLREFLSSVGLHLEKDMDFTVILYEGEDILASGSRRGNVLQCIGVSSEHQGEGLSDIIVTELTKQAFSQGINHLFLYTSPNNARLFAENGFYTVAQTDRVLLMENKRNGVKNFVKSIGKPDNAAQAGCIIANCNPFTLGHQYLAEYAAGKCTHIHFFVLSENKSLFSTETRFNLAKQNLAHLPNVSVHLTGDYLISAATFPDYFLKDNIAAEKAYYDLDIAVFARHFVVPLAIKTRFVGSEPIDSVTAGYNTRLRELLPGFGVTVDELPRITLDGVAISAGYVRCLIKEKAFADLAPLVPETTLAYIMEMTQHAG